MTSTNLLQINHVKTVQPSWKHIIIENVGLHQWDKAVAWTDNLSIKPYQAAQQSLNHFAEFKTTLLWVSISMSRTSRNAEKACFWEILNGHISLSKQNSTLYIKSRQVQQTTIATNYTRGFAPSMVVVAVSRGQKNDSLIDDTVKRVCMLPVAFLPCDYYFSSLPTQQISSCKKITKHSTTMPWRQYFHVQAYHTKRWNHLNILKFELCSQPCMYLFWVTSQQTNNIQASNVPSTRFAIMASPSNNQKIQSKVISFSPLMNAPSRHQIINRVITGSAQKILMLHTSKHMSVWISQAIANWKM